MKTIAVLLLVATACGGTKSTPSDGSVLAHDAAQAVDAGNVGDAEQPSTLMLTTRCATAAVVGLTWTAPAGSASYAVLRDGTALATTATTLYADQSVAPSKQYDYTVNALDSASNVIAHGALSVTTAAASANGDAPVCPSTLIASMTWNWSSGYNQQNGSDLWPATWGADGNVYTFFGDGGGFYGSDTNGRASWGLAEIATTTPAITSSDATNVYGGLDAKHASTLDGKAGSIIAIGNDFYALGGIYRSGDSGGPSGAPNHYELIYSLGNAYSWQDSTFTFCSDKSAPDAICPTSFINYGKGNAGAEDDYVYMMGGDAGPFFATANVAGPSNTYLMRVRNDQLLTQSAYETYTGLDAKGAPQFDTDLTKKQPIFTDSGEKPIGLGLAVYNPALQRYIGAGQGTIGQAAFFEAEHPWGPWYVLSYYNTNSDGTGGWGKMGVSTGTSGGDSLGINFVNAWTSSDGLTMWAQFSSDGVAPKSALLPGLAGNAFDSYSLVSVTLTKR